MSEYVVRFAFGNEASQLIFLPSWWRLLWWILRKSWRCSYLSIFYFKPEHALPVEEAWPCEDCLRWEECNGVDRDNCPNF